MIDIVNVYAEHYENVTLLAGIVLERNKILNSNVKLERIICYERNNNFRRFLTWLWAFIQLLVKIKLNHKKAFLFIVSNPPFAVFIPLFCKNRFALLIYDIYPDILTEYKIIKKNSYFTRCWERANRKIFFKAEKIYTISKGMREKLSKYSGNKTIEVIPTWTDNKFLKPISKKSNPFIKNHNLQNKFVVIYSGNMGYSHNLDFLVQIAVRIKRDDILFLIIGDGNKNKLLKEKIKATGTSNFKLLPFQDAKDLPFSLSSADLGIVSLGKESSNLSVPSKIYDLMSVGVPVLAVASEESELTQLVNYHEIGKCFLSNSIEEMVQFIIRLADNPDYQRKFKSNSLNASAYFTPGNATKFLI